MKLFIAFAMVLVSAVYAFAQGIPNGPPTAYPVQVFTPDSNYAQTLAPGTKGTATYTVPKGATAVSFQCRNASNAVTAVKVSVNGGTGHMDLSSGTFGVSDKKTKTSTFGFSSYSTASANTCEVWGQ